MEKTFCDLIEIIHFTEDVSAKIHGLPDEAAIYRTIMEEFAQSERYTASILLLRDDGSKLGIAETSIAPEKLQAGEETAGVRLKAYKIDLSKSSIFSQLVREGKTLQVNVSDVIGELFPRPLAYLISKTMGYEQKPCILTPLRRQGKIIGALAVSSPALADYFVPSVRNLAQHISTALELAHEHVERRQADEELREYRDRLEELVEERMAELKQSNEQLQREITERKRVEEALQESESRLSGILSSMVDLIFAFDDEGRFIFHHALRIEDLYVPPDGFIGKKPLEVMPAHLNDLFVEAFERSRKGEVAEFEYWLEIGGRVRWFFAKMSPVLLEGEFTGSVAVIREITERRRVEKALRKSEDRYRSLFNGVPVGINLTTPEGQILDANPALVEMLGYPNREALLAVNATDLYVDPADRRQWQALIEQEGIVRGFEVQLRCCNGTTMWARSNARAVCDANGRVVCYEGSLEDITERKQAEEALRQRTAQLEALRQVDLEIAAEFDLDSLLHSIVSQAVELVRGAAGGLYLYRPDLDKLMWVTSVGPNMAPAGAILHRGEGLSGKVWETGKPLIVDDYQHWESRAAIYEGYPWIAVVGVPIYWGEKFLGVLNVLTDAPRTFSPADAELLSLLATQAAIAIRNVCLFEGELEQRELAGSLGEAAAVITSTLDLDQVLDRILEQVSRVVPNDAANIMFIEGDRARVVRCRGYEHFGAEEFISTVVCHIPEVPGFQQMVRSREPLAIPDTANCPDQVRIPVADWLRSYAASPIIVRGEVIGFLNVDSATSGFFTQADAEALRAFADHAAAAIENARLYTEARRRLQEQTALREAGAFISSTLDAQTVLSRIAEQMCRAVDATSAYISGYDPMTNTSSVLAEHIGPRACPREQVSDLGITYVEDAGDEWLEVTKSDQYNISHIDAPDLIGSEQAHMQQFGAKTILYIPLRTKGQLIGYAEIWESRQRREFMPEEITLCQGIAQQAAIALENARLYEQAQQEIAERKRTEKALKRRAAQLATVNKIGQQIGSVLDLDELLRQMVDLLKEAFGYRYVYILLLDEDSHELVARAGAGPGSVLEGTRIPVGARSINARVARTGEPFLANDVSKEPLYLLLEEIADTKSELCVPIRIKDQVIGTLDVQSTKSNAFDESDLFTLQALASQAGIAIENARLYEESRHRLSELSTIHEISMAATSTMDFDQALERAVDAMQEVLDFQVFGFLLLEESTGELHLHPSYRGIDPEVTRELDLRLGRGITGWVAETGQPLLVPDVSQDPRYLDAIAKIRSEMCVPLKIGEQVIGVIDVESDQINAFSEDDLRLLSTLAGQLAITIENAHLFAETEGKANDLALLLDTSIAISSTLDLDQILETVAHQITTSLVATFCRISLLDETGENLVIRTISPVRGWKAEGGFRQPCPLTMVPWHRQVIETAESVILRQDVPELVLSDEELEVALTDGVKSVALIPLIVGGRVLGVISIGEERGWERSPFTREKVELCQSIAFQAAVAIENAYLYEELQQSFLQTIAALAAAVDAKDRYTGGHSQRTTKLAAAIAEELNLSEKDIELTRYASLLHDVGKIGISERILSKPGPLNEKEWSQIHRHPALGADIVERAASLQKLGPIILYHHERYDGQGYPAGLSGEDIPLKARILAVADAYEAMTSERTYRPAMTVEQALATLRDGADRQWDGELVAVLHRIIREQEVER